jgi:hypothetical protein
MSSKIVLNQDDWNSYLRIKGELLDSKVPSRPSLVIFNLQIISKNSKINFESNDVLIYIFEPNSLSSYTIPITGNNLTAEQLPINSKYKFQVTGPIYQSKIREGGSIKKIGLKLPAIIVGDERLDFGIIDFDLR